MSIFTDPDFPQPVFPNDPLNDLDNPRFLSLQPALPQQCRDLATTLASLSIVPPASWNLTWAGFQLPAQPTVPVTGSAAALPTTIVNDLPDLFAQAIVAALERTKSAGDDAPMLCCSSLAVVPGQTFDVEETETEAPAASPSASPVEGLVVTPVATGIVTNYTALAERFAAENADAEAVAVEPFTGSGGWPAGATGREDGWAPGVRVRVQCEEREDLTSGSGLRRTIVGLQLRVDPAAAFVCNNVNATFPNLGGLPELRTLIVTGCDLNGAEIPWRQISKNFTYLTHLSLVDTNVTGRITSDIGGLEGLEVLRLDGNKGVTGVLPQAVGTLSSLRVLRAANTSLTGVLPTSLRLLTPNLSHLDLANTSLAGLYSPSNPFPLATAGNLTVCRLPPALCIDAGAPAPTACALAPCTAATASSTGEDEPAWNLSTINLGDAVAATRLDANEDAALTADATTTTTDEGPPAPGGGGGGGGGKESDSLETTSV
ncbi:hypothetical protein HDU96_006307 [Phlyctochytrium bullatum]|nr:hypothetical protein HDU96_006307 [Phlyctochytrium bullatum]